MRGVRTGGSHDYKVDCPSPSMPLVYVSRSLFEVGRGGRLRWRWRLWWRGGGCCAVLLANTPDSGDAQAGGVSPPFAVCAHSWFEVFGAWRGAGGEGWGGGRERVEWQVWCPRRRIASLGPVL